MNSARESHWPGPGCGMGGADPELWFCEPYSERALIGGFRRNHFSRVSATFGSAPKFEALLHTVKRSRQVDLLIDAVASRIVGPETGDRSAYWI